MRTMGFAIMVNAKAVTQMISGLICIGIGAVLGFGIASVLATGGWKR